MEDDFSKPKYKDFIKSRAYKHTRRYPVISRERIYSPADKPLGVFGSILIFAAALAISLYAPGAFSMYKAILLSLYFAVFEYLLTLLYARLIVYRFGIFRVVWEHPEEHPEESAAIIAMRTETY